MTEVATPGRGHGEVLWREGRLVPWNEANIHIRAVGHASVSAVFEGIRAYWNLKRRQLYIFRLREHLDRLVASARLARLHITWSIPELEAAALAVVRANRYRADAYIRPWIFVAGEVSELIAPSDAPTETVIDTWPSPESTLDNLSTVRVCTSAWRRISDSQMSPRIKAFANYHQARLATAEARFAGYDLPLFLNDRGHIAEGAGACIALVRHGRLITPPISAGIMESVTRATLLTLASEHLRIPVVERNVDRAELAVADEAFFLGTGWELLPIAEVDALPIGDGKPGPITARLACEYRKIVRGETDEYAQWRMAV